MAQPTASCPMKFRFLPIICALIKDNPTPQPGAPARQGKRQKLKANPPKQLKKILTKHLPRKKKHPQISHNPHADRNTAAPITRKGLLLTNPATNARPKMDRVNPVLLRMDRVKPVRLRLDRASLVNHANHASTVLHRMHHASLVLHKIPLQQAV